MRFFSPALGIAAVGLGGVALAEPSLIVDPWVKPPEPADSWFGPSEPVRHERASAGELVDPWATRPEATAPSVSPGPVVAPLGPVDVPLDLRSLEREVGSFEPSAKPVVIDPWATTAPPELPALAGEPNPTSTTNGGASAWPSRLVEIVDPWRQIPVLARSDRVRLVVDPWAR